MRFDRRTTHKPVDRPSTASPHGGAKQRWRWRWRSCIRYWTTEARQRGRQMSNPALELRLANGDVSSDKWPTSATTLRQGKQTERPSSQRWISVPASHIFLPFFHFHLHPVKFQLQPQFRILRLGVLSALICRIHSTLEKTDAWHCCPLTTCLQSKLHIHVNRIALERPPIFRLHPEMGRRRREAALLPAITISRLE